MSPKHRAVTEQIRAEIAAQGLTAYRVANDTGISESTIYRFVAGEGELRGGHVNMVADYLGLRLVRADELKDLRRKAKG
jgi:DNA-binding phage protein